ncbi:toll/interleukin-1 receptor domain-containing protein [Pseudoalteromonas sp. S4741]|uniref:toll/interleukin-1 receptor domain-containing protein n=1 Tax=Pseudoalteromonas sp. S4741 TaxID=579563 RepID=UPI00110B67FC|nr:toll/interleukin-1 receptor domain-containing protein [Pseudoalteromonas sp. S4741]TMO21022.1 toll/interleukin-1 receptor domain-containing protein [Pseudoalteromonas sp. S4741]
MIKAFLSHSSQDKEHYVRNVANWLDKDDIIYDEYTFEEGERPLDQIIDGLDKSEIFVIFLSDNALNSEWVIKEITEAKIRLDSDQINKIFPIIIDDKIQYTDSRIPEWLRDNYNLKPIKRANVAARRIHNKLREVSWTKHPELKIRENYFVGRLTELDSFEERIHDFSKEKPTVLICSGFNGVGRRSLIHKGCLKTNISECSHKPSAIFLDRNVSIEDFILKLNDFGLIDFGDSLEALSDKTVDEKIGYIHQVMNAAYNSKELIYFIDDGCLVNYKRELNSWFEKAISTYNKTAYPVFCIASKYKVAFPARPKNDSFFFLEITELSTVERRRFFSQLAGLYKLELSLEQFDDICNLLSGLPEQVAFAADMLREDNQTSFHDKLAILADYNSERAATLLNKYESKESTLDFIRMLSKFEVITMDFLFSIVNEEEFYPVIEELAAEHIIELIGLDGDIVRLNDVVRDYIARNRLTFSSELSERITERVKTTIERDDLFELDSSEFIFSIKEALKEGTKIDDKFLIPSHYLRCMKDLYYNRGSLQRIIDLADLILEKKSNIDDSALQDIRYYLCLALAKTKNPRLLKEVQLINGDEHDFLLGFYYRLQGRYKDALERFQKIENSRYVAARCKREIVQVYVQMEEYDKALDYAKKNYEDNRSNQFHTQAYFNCLINTDEAKKNSALLKELIHNLRSIGSEQSIEMSNIAEAIFEAKINDSEVTAFDKIKDCIAIYPENHYPLLAACDIALKFNNLEEFESALEELLKISKNNHISQRSLNRYRALSAALKGDEGAALSLIRDDINRYPEESRQRTTRMICEFAKRGRT